MNQSKMQKEQMSQIKYFMACLIISLLSHSCNKSQINNTKIQLQDLRVSFYLPSYIKFIKNDTTNLNTFPFFRYTYCSINGDTCLNLYYPVKDVLIAYKDDNLDTALFYMFHNIWPPDSGDCNIGKVVSIDGIRYIRAHKSTHYNNKSLDILYTNKKNRYFKLVLENKKFYTCDTNSYKQFVDSVFSSVSLKM